MIFLSAKYFSQSCLENDDSMLGSTRPLQGWTYKGRIKVVNLSCSGLKAEKIDTLESDSWRNVNAHLTTVLDGLLEVKGDCGRQLKTNSATAGPTSTVPNGLHLTRCSRVSFADRNSLKVSLAVNVRRGNVGETFASLIGRLIGARLVIELVLAVHEFLEKALKILHNVWVVEVVAFGFGEHGGDSERGFVCQGRARMPGLGDLTRDTILAQMQAQRTVDAVGTRLSQYNFGIDRARLDERDHVDVKALQLFLAEGTHKVHCRTRDVSKLCLRSRCSNVGPNDATFTTDGDAARHANRSRKVVVVNANTKTHERPRACLYWRVSQYCRAEQQSASDVSAAVQ